MSACLHQSVEYQSDQQPQRGLVMVFPWQHLASLFNLPKPSVKLYTGSERLAAAGASAEALRGEHRGNDFIFSSIRAEYVSVTGFEGAESTPCKLWDVETELYSCPLTSVTWSHSSGLQASRRSPKSHLSPVHCYLEFR